VASENQDEPKELLVLNHWQSKRLAKHVMWNLKSIRKAKLTLDSCIWYKSKALVSAMTKIIVFIFCTRVQLKTGQKNMRTV
jgi:hypothetical protein